VPAYIGIVIFVVMLCVHYRKEIWLKASLTLHVVLMLLFVGFPLYQPWLTAQGVTWVSRGVDIRTATLPDPFARFLGYEEVARQIEQRLKDMPEATLVVNDRKLIAELYYHMATTRPIIRFNPDDRMDDYFSMTTSMSDAASDEYLLVTPYPIPHLSDYFLEIEALLPIARLQFSDRTDSYQIFRVKGYRHGGLDEARNDLH
jgi:hypothetical protein